MKIGRWVPVYQRLVPIPRSIDIGLGLFEDSELHIAVIEGKTAPEYRADLVLSPVPAHVWRSACRLAADLPDTVPALLAVMRFLREQRVDVLSSEYTKTLSNRARFAAVCDISRIAEYERLAATPREEFTEAMWIILSRLTSALEEYLQVELPADSGSHLTGHAYVTSLPGLNQASFMARFDRMGTLRYRAGAVELPDSLSTYVSYACNLDPPTLPAYVLLTANRDEHYIRMAFLRDVARFFEFTVETATTDFAGSNGEILDQFFRALPQHVGLVSAATQVTSASPSDQRGRIDLVGAWRDATRDAPTRSDAETHLRGAINGMAFCDRDGRLHENLVQLVSFSTARTVHPRVYISYSAGRVRDQRLVELLSALSENYFEPVFGGESAESADDSTAVTPDVLRTTFSTIATCVAVISLHTKRDDYAVMGTDGRPRYILPPWVAAEEAYAIVSSPLVLRLRGKDVEDPRYGRNTLTWSFDEKDDASYSHAVQAAVSELNSFRATERFRSAWQNVQRTRFREIYAPPVL